MSAIIFTEKQRLSGLWLWIIFLIAIIPLLLIYFFAKEGIIVSSLIIIPIMVLLLLLKLTTTITPDGIRVKFFPLYIFDQEIKWEDISDIYIRKYKPIAEYGGWGVRWSGKNGTAYTTQGYYGIQLVLKNNKKVLIGTQQSTQIEVLISEWKNKFITN